MASGPPMISVGLFPGWMANVTTPCEAYSASVRVLSFSRPFLEIWYALRLGSARWAATLVTLMMYLTPLDFSSRGRKACVTR